MLQTPGSPITYMGIYIGVERVDDGRQGPAKSAAVAVQRGGGLAVAAFGQGGDHFGRGIHPGFQRVIARQRRTGAPRLDTTEPPTGATRRVGAVVAGQERMPPFPGDGIGAPVNLAAQCNSAADAGADHDAEDDIGGCGGAKLGFGQGKAVCIVFLANRPPERCGQIPIERVTVEAGRRRVSHQSSGRRESARRADADPVDPGADMRLGPVDETADCAQHFVIVRGHRHPLAKGHGVGCVQDGDFNLGAADVYPDSHGIARRLVGRHQRLQPLFNLPGAFGQLRLDDPKFAQLGQDICQPGGQFFLWRLGVFLGDASHQPDKGNVQQSGQHLQTVGAGFRAVGLPIAQGLQLDAQAAGQLRLAHPGGIAGAGQAVAQRGDIVVPLVLIGGCTWRFGSGVVDHHGLRYPSGCGASSLATDSTEPGAASHLFAMDCAARDNMGSPAEMTVQSDNIRHVLVVGAYGLIGAGIVRDLIARGHRVTGLGRDPLVAKRVLPQIEWVIRDLRAMTNAEAWRPLLAEIDVVVNASGVLQESGRDDLAAVQVNAVAALAAACAASGTGLVQISAVGAAPDAATPFMTTKATADQAIADSGASYWIFRPGLVLAQNAFGGSALIRMLAAVPLVQPVALAETPIQTVGLPDIAGAVAMAVDGRLSPGLTCDLVEDVPQRLGDVILAHRKWLGFAPGRIIRAPGWALRPVAWGADLLAHLGWRSPLRSTALAVLADGIKGDPTAWRAAAGKSVAGMEETLGNLSLTSEHRLAARAALLMPIVIAVLSVFWLASGIIGFFQAGTAAKVLIDVGWAGGLALASVWFWSVVDIVLGVAVLLRRWAKTACLGMIAVSLIYLGAATVFTPGLWLDPLGPLVKVIPGAMLAAVALILLDER